MQGNIYFNLYFPEVYDLIIPDTFIIFKCKQNVDLKNVQPSYEL